MRLSAAMMLISIFCVLLLVGVFDNTMEMPRLHRDINLVASMLSEQVGCFSMRFSVRACIERAIFP